MSEPWKDDRIQFARLLAEISAIGLCPEDKQAICESMDLEPAELEALFSRAEASWEEIKVVHGLPGEAETLLTIQYRCPVAVRPLLRVYPLPDSLQVDVHFAFI